jgi:hypothetical protein
MSHDLTIDEKRVYGDRTSAVEVLVASDQGVVAAAVSGDRVGEFRLDHRAAARDVAATADRRAVATDEDVLVGDYEATGFGPAQAVDFHNGTLLVAGTDGRIARLEDGAWTTLGHVEAPRAVDAGMVAAGDGVHQVVDDGLRAVGLDDARDVAAGNLPLAATGGGLYRLGNGWMDELDGAFDAVSVAADGRAHAAGAGVFERETVASWTRLDLPTDERVVDVGHTAAAALAVTESGTLLASATEGDGAGRTGGWRTRKLGVSGVGRLAVA